MELYERRKQDISNLWDSSLIIVYLQLEVLISAYSTYKYTSNVCHIASIIIVYMHTLLLYSK